MITKYVIYANVASAFGEQDMNVTCKLLQHKTGIKSFEKPSEGQQRRGRDNVLNQ